MFELTPAILNVRVDINASSDSNSVHVAAWRDRDDSIVVIAANADPTTIETVTIDCRPFLNAGYSAVARVQFGAFDIPIDASIGTLQDTLRPMAVAVYRLTLKIA